MTPEENSRIAAIEKRQEALEKTLATVSVDIFTVLKIILEGQWGRDKAGCTLLANTLNAHMKKLREEAESKNFSDEQERREALDRISRFETVIDTFSAAVANMKTKLADL
jgi:hypothetical protein